MPVSEWTTASAVTAATIPPSTGTSPPDPLPLVEPLLAEAGRIIDDLNARVQRLEADLIGPDGGIGGF